MSNLFYTETPAYRLHQLADLVDAQPILNDEKRVRIHADSDTVGFHLADWDEAGDRIENAQKIETVREIIKALATIGVQGWKFSTDPWTTVSLDDTPINGYRDYSIFAHPTILEEALNA